MRVMVTGASGFIGSHLVSLLLQEKVEVYVLLRPKGNPWRIHDLLPNLKVVEGDLLDAEQEWLESIGAIHLDTCFHFAWYAEPGVFLTSPLNLQYLSASLKLAEGLAKAGCKKIVIAGSFSEYNQDLGYLSENSALRPNTPYGAAKVALYQALSLWAPRE